MSTVIETTQGHRQSRRPTLCMC